MMLKESTNEKAATSEKRQCMTSDNDVFHTRKNELIGETSALEDTLCVDVPKGENSFKIQNIPNTIIDGTQLLFKEPRKNSSASTSKQENILLEGKPFDSKLFPYANDKVEVTHPNMQVPVQKPREDSFDDLSNAENTVDEGSSQKVLIIRRPYIDAEGQLLSKIYEHHRGDWKAISEYYPGRTIQSVGFVSKLL
jgi:hypothetical protein